MGLSIYFSKVNKRDYSLNKETAINDEIEIGYFRDVNCLLPFFGYENNQEYLEIRRFKIHLLLATVKNLLAIYNKIGTSEIFKTFKFANTFKFIKIAKEELPTLDGFYCEDYVYDLQEIEKVFEKILEETDFENEQVLMYCWW